MLSRCFWDFSVSVGAFVIGLAQIFSVSLFVGISDGTDGILLTDNALIYFAVLSYSVAWLLSPLLGSQLWYVVPIILLHPLLHFLMFLPLLLLVPTCLSAYLSPSSPSSSHPFCLK